MPELRVILEGERDVAKRPRLAGVAARNRTREMFEPSDDEDSNLSSADE